MKETFFVPGFKLSGVFCGLKKNKNTPDLALILAEKNCSVAGVFTTNWVKAAPVIYSQKIIKAGRARALVANSGGANAFTGAAGLRDIGEVVTSAARLLKISSKLILVASTGKIGPRLQVRKIKNGLKKAVAKLSPTGWEQVASAIMTTDTQPKMASKKVNLSYGAVRLGAIAKGAGMINPDLATMLVFILTDLKASAAVLATLLKKSVSESFNLLTVDNCGSTNDSVFLLASGVGQKNFLKNGTADYRKFQAALTGLCRDLCRQLAADGEGATKLIEVQVKNVFSREAARILAKAVAGSALVKAAVFGADPNWGRILAALGSTRIKFAPGRIEVFLGPNRVVSSGRGIDFNRKRLKTYLSGKIVRIIIDCHQGNNSAVAFGCDLSYDYVRINAEYN